MILGAERESGVNWAHESTFSLTSGTVVDGVWQGQIVLREGTPKGRYRIAFWTLGHDWQPPPFPESPFPKAHDFSGATLRAAGLPNSFEQVGDGDQEPPKVESVKLSPGSLDTSTGPGLVEASIRISDDLSGTEMVFAEFAGPAWRSSTGRGWAGPTRATTSQSWAEARWTSAGPVTRSRRP